VALPIALLTLVLAAIVVLFVSAPLRRARGETSTHAHDDLEAAREAKYREIRDAELDYRTGKLSQEDYQAIDADLRAEAIAILDRIEQLTPKGA
jgi:hypothetical protein